MRLATSPNPNAVSNYFVDSRGLLTLFAILFGLITAVLSGYRYGLWDHAEQLPVIFRIMDPGYLGNDFFVNVASEFGPRFYYSHALAFAAAYIPLPILIGILWLSCFLAVVVITAHAARDLSGSHARRHVGGGPRHPSRALLLRLQSRRFERLPSCARDTSNAICAFCTLEGNTGSTGQRRNCLDSRYSHPAVLGLEMGGLALAAAGGRRVILPALRGEYDPINLRSLALGILIVGLTSLVWILPTISTGASSLKTDEFVQIYAHFRHPHHLIPSTWDMTQWVLGALFAATLVIGLVESFQRKASQNTEDPKHLGGYFAVATILAVIAAALAVGYVFVEIVPSRIATVAQTFRMVEVLGWLGWILMAILIADLLSNKGYRWAALFAASTFSVPSLFLYKVVTFTTSKLKSESLLRSSLFFAGVVMLVAVTLIGTRRVLTDEHAITELAPIAFGFLLVWQLPSSQARPRGLGNARWHSGPVGDESSAGTHDMLPSDVPGVSSYLADKQPVLTLDDAKEEYEHDHIVELATTAKDATHPDSVFLVPHNWYVWRLFSERAIVVDHKAFPFRDEGMKEWYERYVDIYGEGTGYPENATEDELLELQAKYGFHYAVLPVEAIAPSLPVVDSSGGWKIVRVADVGSR